MKNHNLRHPKTASLSEQRRAILAEAICALIDILLDLLIAVDPAPPYGVPFIGWELPAASRRSRRHHPRLVDDNADFTYLTAKHLDLTQGASMQPPLPSGLGKGNEPGVQYFWAYPLQAVWDKKFRTSQN